MKKGKGVLLFLGLLWVTPFVSAQSGLAEGTRQFIDGIVSIFGPIFDALLNTQNSSSEFLFAKILVFFLLFMIVYAAVKKIHAFGRVKGFAPLIAIIISLISVRFMSESNVFGGIFLPYGVFGITAITVLPTLIFFWLVHVSVKMGFARRLLGFVYGFAYLVYWISRLADGQIPAELNWIFIATFVFIIAAFFFDKSLQGYFKAWELSMFHRGVADRTAAALQAEYLRIVNVNTQEAVRRRSSIEGQLSRMGRDLP